MLRQKICGSSMRAPMTAATASTPPRALPSRRRRSGGGGVRTNIVGKSGPSIDGSGAAKEDESTGAVGAHRGMNVWRCRRRVWVHQRGR